MTDMATGGVAGLKIQTSPDLLESIKRQMEFYFSSENLASDKYLNGQMDENKSEIEGSDFELSADLILLAIGQEKQGSLLAGLPGIEIEWGKVVVNEDGATGCPGVFAGGDCINGGKEVVNAVADGDKAAKAIHRYVTGGKNG